MTADIGLGDQRKRQAAGAQGLARPIEVGTKSAGGAAARHADEIGNPAPLARGHIEEIIAFGLAPEPAGPAARIGDGRQGQRPVADGKRDPGEDQRQMEQAERDAFGSRPAQAARCRRS